MNRFLIIIALFAGACSKSAPVSHTSAGKAYFTQAGCTNCHKIGEDGSAVGPDLTVVGYRHSAMWLDLFIKDPQAWKKDTLMPNKRMSDAARAAIVDYLSQLKGQDWPKGARPWDDASLIKDPKARGRVIYARAGCVGCHGPAGGGGYPNNNVKGGLIPALHKVTQTYTKAELIAKIKKGVPHPEKADPKGPEPLIWMPAWSEMLDDAEIDAVASYLLTLSPADSEKPEF